MSALEKKASLVVKNIGELENLLNDYQGSLKDAHKSAKNIVKEMVYGSGPGFKRKLADFDVAAGRKIYDAALNSKSKVINKISPAVIQKYTVPLRETAKGMPDYSLNVGMPMLSAVLSKAKPIIIPAVTATAVHFATQNKKKKDDDNVMQNAREESVKKMASVVCDHSQSSSGDVDFNSALSMLSNFCTESKELLKTSSELTKALLKENQELKQEILNMEKTARDYARLEEAETLATLMSERGMIKRADIFEKQKEMLTFSDETFKILKEAVESLPSTLMNKESYVNDLTFLSSEINMEERAKRTLADSISEESKKYI